MALTNAGMMPLTRPDEVSDATDGADGIRHAGNTPRPGKHPERPGGDFAWRVAYPNRGRDSV